jgi:hypothetical protein
MGWVLGVVNVSGEEGRVSVGEGIGISDMDDDAHVGETE